MHGVEVSMGQRASHFVTHRMRGGLYGIQGSMSIQAKLGHRGYGRRLGFEQKCVSNARYPSVNMHSASDDLEKGLSRKRFAVRVGQYKCCGNPAKIVDRENWWDATAQAADGAIMMDFAVCRIHDGEITLAVHDLAGEIERS